ncbi:MAG TPA: diaminopimelate dehydrogenase [Symbiobacteriaceae bacterium]|nr:diaminopimelate dehydrogenase [Symbiobacteriaceae bacterium]
MSKSRIAVVGYGHVGKAAVQALTVAEDMQLAGVVDRAEVLAEVRETHLKVPVSERLCDLGEVDVALLCIPSRMVPVLGPEILRQGVNTVDCFDIHGRALAELKDGLRAAACTANRVAVTACGWDPGVDSLIRAIFLAAAPRGLTFTNHGPGVSLGHSVAARAVPGVRDAMSVTVPMGSGLHRRVVYVALEPKASLAEVTERLRQDDYFSHDELAVVEVLTLRDLMDVGHGVVIERKGASGQTDNQLFKFEARINNPALTAQVMVAGARAVKRLSPGCYTLLDIPIGYLSQYSPDELALSVV